MDEQAELAQILGHTESEDVPEVAAPPPADGLPEEITATAAAEAEGDDEPLSPEERVAELVRQDLERDGIALDAPDESTPDDPEMLAGDDAEEDDESTPLIPEPTSEEAAQWRAWYAEQKFRDKEAAILSKLEQDVAKSEAHYADQLEELLGDVERDSHGQPDPDAYRKTHRAAVIRAVRASERAWLKSLGEKAEGDLQGIDGERKAQLVEQARPAWAEKLVADRRLPKSVIPHLLAIKDPNEMQAVADLLVKARNENANVKRKATQDIKEAKAKEVAANQVHPGSTGRAPRPKDVQYVGVGEEGMRELAAIMSLPG